MSNEAKDDGGGGDNWTTGAVSRVKLQSIHHHQLVSFCGLKLLQQSTCLISQGGRRESTSAFGVQDRRTNRASLPYARESTQRSRPFSFV